MLKNLLIQNYAIIDEVVIGFSGGMNVITGETGAGKSILMGALSLILGDRADTTVLLERQKKCIVEGTFEVDPRSQLIGILQRLELIDEQTGGSEVVIRREIANTGKSRAFVNDTPVNLEQLKLVSSLLVDLHRQFDTLSLSDSDFQLNVLDALADNAQLLDKYRSVYADWKQVDSKLSTLTAEKQSFTRGYDYNKFLFDELAEAAFHENEIEEAEQELKLLSNAENIKSALLSAVYSLSAGEDTVLQQLKTIQHQLDSITRYHEEIADVAARLHSSYLELQDVSGEIERINDRTQLDQRRIDGLNERLSTAYKLMKKHGVKTTADLLAIQDELARKLEAVLNIDEEISRHEVRAAELYSKVELIAADLSVRRNKQVSGLEKKVNKLLEQVGMPNARLKVSVERKNLDVSGCDEVEFLFDANKSGRFEPVRRVASGGELSRLMLSIKSLVAESMDLPTLIFDEIDTGISGEAARQVGVIMQSLANKRQIITITHQPQIAGRAGTHLFVYKESKHNNIRTGIRILDREERITAIAKMLSGEKPTAAAMENAREMVMN